MSEHEGARAASAGLNGTARQVTGGQEARVGPADVEAVRFSSAGVLQRGYDVGQVDDFLDRVRAELERAGTELQRLEAESAALREELRAVREEPPAAPAPVDPTEQAVGILMAAQQTADQYVADAEGFSRMLAGQAREQYENLLQRAREEADEVLRAAHAAAGAASAGPLDASAGPAAPPAPGVPAQGPTAEEVREQVAYLQAFGRACRTQLRTYLEGLLADVEAQWGRADPSALPAATAAAGQRTAPGGTPLETPLPAPGAVDAHRAVVDLTGSDRTAPAHR
ncbi:DivIVA domain-containing protein [Kineococcus indalonis]|uniref:DivIVA domain-containing protein n=1 Tax=Kineococcus indalonis TaxID=2696566 RepID=UPI0014129D96|nr:DivIVA domain-containing protein [Kineococcus indalonis]NAZ85669.1 DivIVA domain-containing protein [Kineococcus indalonis]